jgi:hypothetical protein
VYSLVKNVTPGTASTTGDSPGAGTWYYVLKTTFQNWSSVNSNQATAVVSITSTTYKPCVTTLADTLNAGDNNGYQSNPARSCVSDTSYAQDTNTGSSFTSASCGVGSAPDSGKDRHQFWAYVFVLPPLVAHIDGIRVQADVMLDALGGTNNLCAQLSWDGGSHWTTIKTQAITVAAKTTYIFGGTADLWGRGWTQAELDPTLFRVRIIDASTINTRDYNLDYLAVSITYAP